MQIIGAPGRSGGGGGDEDTARDSVVGRDLETEGEEKVEEEEEKREEEEQDCSPSVSSTSEDCDESAHDQGASSSNESSGSGMEGQSEPEIVAEKVKYLCGEDEDTLPDRFGDKEAAAKKIQVQFGEKRPSFAIFACFCAGITNRTKQAQH